MDPVSIVASSMAFIGVCRKLVTGLKFLHDLSRAPKEVLAMTDELSDLEQVLTAVGFVARKWKDDDMVILLSPLFIKVDRIIHELCDLCGACPQRLKEDDEYIEQLKHCLLARFKWTRAKRRVFELRERLKIIRLDLANSLATISLLHTAQISSKMNNNFVGVQDTNEVSKGTPAKANTPPRYNEMLKQNAETSKPKVLDIEAQRGNYVTAEKGSALAKTEFRTTGFNVGSCLRACSCRCHTVYRVKTPSFLQNLTGSLLIKSNGLYGLNQGCNEYSCRQNASASIRISYRFPEWFLKRMVSSLIVSNRLNGPQLSLVVPRIVSRSSDIFFQASAGRADVVAKLLQSGLASPCDIDHLWGYTPLHYAVDRGHYDVCRLLLNAGARADITDLDENSVSDIAWNKICSKKISVQDAAALETLFKKDDWFEERQFTLLHKIVLDLLPVRRSLEQELSISTVNIEVADSEGRTPLSWAAECGNLSAVETLLAYKATISTKSIKGLTPLHYAAKAPSAACLSTLLEYGALVAPLNNWKQTPLNLASYFQNDPSYFIPLLQHGANINEIDCYGSTALMNALFMNNDLSAKCLIAHGAQISELQRHTFTGFNCAIETNSHECISLLFDSGASLSALYLNGETVLHTIARRGDLRTLEIFLAAELESLDVDAKTTAGLTAWDLMQQRMDVGDDEVNAFRRLVAKFDSKTTHVTYFDALEETSMPPMDGKYAGFKLDVLEVKVEEILAV